MLHLEHHVGLVQAHLRHRRRRAVDLRDDRVAHQVDRRQESPSAAPRPPSAPAAGPCRVVVGATTGTGAVVLGLVVELGAAAAVLEVEDGGSVVVDASAVVGAAAATAGRTGRRCATSDPSVTVTATHVRSAAASPTRHHAAVGRAPTASATAGAPRLPCSSAHQRSSNGEGSSISQTSTRQPHLERTWAGRSGHRAR